MALSCADSVCLSVYAFTHTHANIHIKCTCMYSVTLAIAAHSSLFVDWEKWAACFYEDPADKKWIYLIPFVLKFTIFVLNNVLVLPSPGFSLPEQPILRPHE